MSRILLKLFWSFLLHLFLGGLAILTIGWIASDQRVLAQEVLFRLADNPAALEQRRSDIAGILTITTAVAILGSFLWSGLWLFITERAGPIDDSGARSATGAWIALLFASLVTVTLAGWFQIWRPLVILEIATGAVPKAGVVALGAVFLSFYLATALLVKRSMRASVPLALLFVKF